MTGFKSKQAVAQAKLHDDDDIQDYKRPWVGLTEDDIREIIIDLKDSIDLYKAIEAKLKQKNTQLMPRSPGFGCNNLELEPMRKEIEQTIKLLAEKTDGSLKSEDALRYTQAALNLAHVLAVFHNIGPTNNT